MYPLVLPESFFLRPEASRPEYWASQDLWVFHHTVGKTLGPSRCLARIVVFKPHHKQVFWQDKKCGWVFVTASWLSMVVEFPLAGYCASELLKLVTALAPCNCVAWVSPLLGSNWRNRFRVWLASTQVSELRLASDGSDSRTANHLTQFK